MKLLSLTVVPGPVTNLSATAAGSSEIVVKWDRPKNWPDGDMLLKFVLEYEQEYSSDVYKVLYRFCITFR